MKHFVLSSTAIVLLLAASAASGESACRDFREPVKQQNLNSVIAVHPSVLPSVSFEDRSPTDTFAIKGTFCDGELSALGGKSLRVILIERAEAAGEGPLPAHAFTSGLARRVETREVVTTPRGKFRVTGLSAGEYVVEIGWDELSSTPFVVLDLEHIPGPPLRTSVEQVGLIRP